MTAPANAYQRKDITHELEEIRDVIDDVSPTLTPFYTNALKGRTDNTTYEWHTDELDAVQDPYGSPVQDAPGTNLQNAWTDGNTFAATPITATVRLKNECQIQRKDFTVTRRARRINKAGQRDELARQVVRKGLELRRDGEVSLLANVAYLDPGDNGVLPPLLAGLPTYITGNRASRGATTGADGTGDGSDVKVDGDARAMSETLLLGVVSAIYEESNELPNVWMVPSRLKQNISSYLFTSSARVATQYQDQGASPRGGVTVVGAVDTYVADFAVLDIVPNRFIPAHAAAADEYDTFIYSTEYCECVAFDPMSTEVIAKRSDTDERMIIHDHTLCVRNPKTVGTVADIDVTLAMVA